MKLLNAYTSIFTLLSMIILSSCTSYEKYRFITEEYEIPSEVMKSNFNQSWLAVIQVMKKFDLEIQNQEAGIIKTRWIDNTLELNFTDSFSKSDKIKGAKFKLIINLVKGYKGRGEVTKISIYKRQVIEQDTLQGWKELPSDTIQEKTLLYRIKRILDIEKQLQKIEQMKQKEQEESLL